MTELYQRLKKYRDQKGVDWETIELDYALSWMLVAISSHPRLAENLVFKGDTALKKCYFGDYRFSEDLDFTEIQGSTNLVLYQDVLEAAKKASVLASSYGDFKFTVEEYVEKNPHPFNQAAFTIKVQLPWQRRAMTKLKLEVSRDEHLSFAPVKRLLLHDYGEIVSCQIQTYVLEEIVIEKFRGILQNQESLIRKGWVRSRVRDFYDLWRILNQYPENLDLSQIRAGFLKKCQLKAIDFKDPNQFFESNYLNYIQKDWKEFLKKLTPELPDFNEVVLKLRDHAHEIF